ncbi:MAG: phosphoglycerate kinase [Gammaproteobacteria bacterium]|nr:phosphoglycerate kinase [Gammaproteobacteria bacterium]|tara:strand:+ start:204 stop:1364 length:1161 start_codon:yes stop_codon:yes gene_type:complete
MPKLLKWQDISNSRVLLRLDLNVPINNGVIDSDFRIIQSLPTIRKLLDNDNKVIILSHLGRPSTDRRDPSFSLKIIANYMSNQLNEEINLVDELDKDLVFENSRICMIENIRYFSGEKDNDQEFSRILSQHADYFVFDAFGVSHRTEASTYGLMNFLDYAPGPLIISEIENTDKILSEPKSPLCTIISGAKISTKLSLLKTFVSISDYVILGGGILNTYLYTNGYEIGNSLCEKDINTDYVDVFNHGNKNKIIMPRDVVCATGSSMDNYQTKDISMVQLDDKILDVGIESVKKYTQTINDCSTVFWNGPLGFVEKNPYDAGTKAIIKLLAESKCYSMIGGGDTVSVVEKMKLEDKISYISTGGGALLKYIEGKNMPVLEKLGLKKS